MKPISSFILCAAALLTGCASFSPDGGFAEVEKTAQAQLGKELRWARTDTDRQHIQRRVTELLARPLGADDAMQIALLNNSGLQAAFFELGITEAQIVQAAQLPNPGFSFARRSGAGEVEIERGLHFNIARLLVLPLTRPIEARRLAQVQQQIALRVLTLAADTRKAHVQAVAARESVRYLQQVQAAAQAGAELARRMEAVGNFNKLQRAREQGFQADAALNLAHAEQLQRHTLERLTRLLGLWGDQAAVTLPQRLPERLPDLPQTVVDEPGIERRALAQRLDVQAARAATEQTADQLGLTRTTRFINVFELGLTRSGTTGATTQRGWEISFELPLFDWGQARVAHAEAVYMQSLANAAQIAIEARSEIREAYSAYRSAWDIARHHRDQIVPLRKLIADETLLRYNGMLIGVFELLADARLQISSVNASMQALRDFWLAQADLELALIGKPASMAAAGGAAPAGAADAPSPH